MRRLITSLFFLIISVGASAYEDCLQNVDMFNIFYVNGMFTNFSTYKNNIVQLKRFYGRNLQDLDVTNSGVLVEGSHNPSEFVLAQFKQVSEHKFSELRVSNSTKEEISHLFGGFEIAPDSGDGNDEETEQTLNAIMKEIDATYTKDKTFNTAYERISSLLSNCRRTLLIGHSQGNFYANALIDRLYATYRYDDNHSLHDFPMLGYYGFALPTSTVGGITGLRYPHLVGAITNNNDLIMAAVRLTVGAVPSNFNNPFSWKDWTGHGLNESYISEAGQQIRASSDIKHIARQTLPFPLFEQHSSSSSAIKSYGFSLLSEILDIKFQDDSKYRYYFVPRVILKDFHDSTSKGGFFNANIKGVYPFIKIE